MKRTVLLAALSSLAFSASLAQASTEGKDLARLRFALTDRDALIVTGLCEATNALQGNTTRAQMRFDGVIVKDKTVKMDHISVEYVAVGAGEHTVELQCYNTKSDALRAQLTSRFRTKGDEPTAESPAAETARKVEGVLVTQDKQWVSVPLGKCRGMFHGFNFLLEWWSGDPNARFGWTGKCREGLINGPGTISMDFRSKGIHFVLQKRGSAQNGLVEGTWVEAWYSDMNMRFSTGSRSPTGTREGFTPPAGLTWYDNGVTNPLANTYQHGCTTSSIGYDGESGCDPKAGVAAASQLADALRQAAGK